MISVSGWKVHFAFRMCYVAKSGNIYINTWKVLKCGAGEGWRRSVGPIM
jgi:hypothetical protein